MAEERLIDDDLNKDKKYRIRKNADGEDELYIDDSVEEDLSLEAISFTVPEFAEGDGVLTPDQIAAAEEEKRARAEQIKSALSINIEKANSKLLEGDFESALKFADAALKVSTTSGAACALKLRALTKDFTDVDCSEECQSAAAKVAAHCNTQQKEELSALSSPLQNKVYKIEEQAAALHVEVEQKKDERRKVFLQDRKKSVKWFSLTALPFLACLVVAIAFASVMFAKEDGTNMILAAVFAGLAVLFFIASFVTGHKMWEAMKKLSLNEKNSSTQIGRDYEDMLEIIKKLNTVLNSFKQ